MTLSEPSPSSPNATNAAANIATSLSSTPTDTADSAPASKPRPQGSLAGFWPVFFSTFLTIFLAELGDKTQVTTLLMSAESQSPVSVFLGAGLALVSTSLIGVLLGQWLASRVSEDTLDTCAGVLLMLITIGLVADIIS